MHQFSSFRGVPTRNTHQQQQQQQQQQEPNAQRSPNSPASPAIPRHGRRQNSPPLVSGPAPSNPIESAACALKYNGPIGVQELSSLPLRVTFFSLKPCLQAVIEGREVMRRRRRRRGRTMLQTVSDLVTVSDGIFNRFSLLRDIRCASGRLTLLQVLRICRCIATRTGGWVRYRICQHYAALCCITLLSWCLPRSGPLEVGKF